MGPAFTTVSQSDNKNLCDVPVRSTSNSRIPRVFLFLLLGIFSAMMMTCPMGGGGPPARSLITAALEVRSPVECM